MKNFTRRGFFAALAGLPVAAAVPLPCACGRFHEAGEPCYRHVQYSLGYKMSQEMVANRIFFAAPGGIYEDDGSGPRLVSIADAFPNFPGLDDMNT